MAKSADQDPALQHESLAKSDKQRRKAEKRAAKAAATQPDTQPDTTHKRKADNGNADVELSKGERRALKRARKEKEKENGNGSGTGAEANANHTSPEEQPLSETHEKKALRKALRKAEKAAQKTAGITTALPDTNVPRQRGRDHVSSYQESSALSAVPQSTIDAYTADQQLSIEDPDSQDLRPIVEFSHLSLAPSLTALLAGFSSPTPVQAACWPYLFAGRDVIGVAETGSGKTIAFGLPCIRFISGLERSQRQTIKACVVSPTRELALQIQEQLTKLAEPLGLKVTCVYGGTNKDEQRVNLRGTNVVVATPGRLNDFITEGSIDLSDVQYLVLDEADRMLDKGFEEDVRKIISSTPQHSRQTLMFTATWPPSVRGLAETFMKTPVKVTIGDNASGELRANKRVVQQVEVVDQRDKQDRLFQLLKQYQSGKNKRDRILVFCLYKKEATRIEEYLRRRGFAVAGIHGDLNQQRRQESLEAFKQGHTPLLVATDVAARGLDIPSVQVVINVTFPLTVEDYVHRIGRTGRAGQSGLAITLFTDNEKALAGALINVLKSAGQPVPDELMKYGTTVKKKGHEAYGAFYKETSDMPKAKKITFD